MSALTDTFLALAKDGWLQHTLEAAMGGHGQGICVALSYKGALHSAAIHGCSLSSPVDVGCLAKSFTATLVAIAQFEGKLSLQDTVASKVDGASSNGAVDGHLTSTRIYHLLNHSNGLDQSLLDSKPTGVGGYVDVPSFIRTLGSANVLAPPGAFYNYTNIGAWLSAGILERSYRRSYRSLLEEKILGPLDIGAGLTLGTHDICPAMGKGLRLSAQDVMKLMLLHLGAQRLRSDLDRHLLELRTDFCVSIPSWPPSGQRAYPGWIDYGGNFGQFGVGEDSSVAVRFFPAEDAAVVVSASHPRLAGVALKTLLGHALDDFSARQPLKLLSPRAWRAADRHQYTGDFENSKYRLTFDIASTGDLRGRVFRKQGDQRAVDCEPYIKRYFRAAANDIFFPIHPEPEVMIGAQFLRSNPSGEFEYVHTGRYAFSRSSGSRDSSVAN